MTLYTPDERDEIATRLIELLRGDERVAHVELSRLGRSRLRRPLVGRRPASSRSPRGSTSGRWQTPGSRAIYEALPVVHHFAVAFGDEHVRGFLLENLLEVDVGFQPAAGREDGEWPGPGSRERGRLRRGTTPLHAGVAVARGRPWRAQYYIGLLRWRTLALATRPARARAHEYKGVDDLPAELLEPLEDALPRSLDPAELSARGSSGHRRRSSTS